MNKTLKVIGCITLLKLGLVYPYLQDTDIKFYVNVQPDTVPTNYNPEPPEIPRIADGASNVTNINEGHKRGSGLDIRGYDLGHTQ